MTLLNSSKHIRMHEIDIIAVIPARGGSKAIPQKNIRLLAGKPLIAYTIEQAYQASYVNRVVVSTDSPQIASVAEQYGAEVIKRPPEISSDTAQSELALLHVLDTLEQREGYEPELIVFLQCTSPLTMPEDIDGTVEALLMEEADSALAVTPFHYFLWRDYHNDSVGVNHDKQVRPLRQERKTQFLETGAVYAMRTDGFRKAKHRFFGKTTMYVMPRERCLEIDEPVDLIVAEALLRKQQEQMKLQLLPNDISGLVLDFDGVFTDNRVHVFEDGREALVCNRSDGLGLTQIKQVAIPVLVLSSEKNSVVLSRCRKLGLESMQSVQDKRTALLDWLQKKKLSAANVVYVGNDINDLLCMEVVGCSVAVSDAHPKVRRAAHIVLSKPGGYGAIREICDLILKKLSK